MYVVLQASIANTYINISKKPTAPCKCNVNEGMRFGDFHHPTSDVIL
jgi:hypothetical protein